MSTTSRKGQYIAQRGDTIEKIAKKLGMPAIMLARQNPRIGNRKLEAGEQIFYNTSPQYGEGTIDSSAGNAGNSSGNSSNNGSFTPGKDSDIAQQMQGMKEGYEQSKTQADRDKGSSSGNSSGSSNSSASSNLSGSGTSSAKETAFQKALSVLKKEGGLNDLSDEDVLKMGEEFRREYLKKKTEESGKGSVYDPNKLTEKYSYEYSDATKRLLASITGDKSYLASVGQTDNNGEPDFSKMSFKEFTQYISNLNKQNKLTAKEQALLTIGELADAASFNLLSTEAPDSEKMYKQALEEVQGDYDQRILNATQSVRDKKRNIQDQKEVSEEKYLRNLENLREQIQNDGEDALQDGIIKGTARSSIQDNLQQEIIQEGQEDALQLKTDRDNLLSRLNRELKDVESAGKATLDLLEKNKKQDAQKEYEKQLAAYNKEQDKISKFNRELSDAPLSSADMLKQLNKLDSKKATEFLESNEKKLRSLWGSEYDRILRQYL